MPSNVDAACGDVGGDHDLVLAGLKAFQCPLSLALRAAGVDGDGFDACPLEAAADLVGAVLGAGKDQYAVHLVVLEHVQQQVDLVFLLDGVDVLRDRLDGVSLLADLYHLRDAFCIPAARSRTSGGMVAENSSVWRFFGHGGDDLSHIVDKAHIEHAVGLVEDQHLDMRKVDAAALHVVEESPRRGDDDIDAAAKGAKLVLDTYAAVNGQRAKMQKSAVVDDAFFDLEGQFARRRKDERL